MRKELTWTTRDGQTLKISEMTDSHLSNTIGFLERRADELVELKQIDSASFAASCSGEMSSYYADHDAESWAATTGKDLLVNHPIYQAMLKERAKRKKNADA